MRWHVSDGVTINAISQVDIELPEPYARDLSGKVCERACVPPSITFHVFSLKLLIPTDHFIGTRPFVTRTCISFSLGSLLCRLRW